VILNWSNVVRLRRVFVTGLARNVGAHLEKEITKLEIQLEKIFDVVKFFIVESDSIDSTPKILNELKKKKNNFDFVSLNHLDGTYPNRIERITYCRNIYVTQIRKINKFEDFDFILIIDFDIKNNRLNLKILDAYLENDSWDGLFVNQKGPYYDIFALRCNGWSDSDCFQEYKELSKVFSSAEAKQIAIWSKMRRIPCNSEVIEVDSAFGGLAVYRIECFLKYDYDDPAKEYIISEHVHFNLRLRSDAGKLFILPALVNFSWSAHNLSKYRILRTLDSLSNTNSLANIRRFIRNRLA